MYLTLTAFSLYSSLSSVPDSLSLHFFNLLCICSIRILYFRIRIEMAAGDVEKAQYPIFRDIRRYYCEFCGICRSKKALIAAHIRTHHEVYA